MEAIAVAMWRELRADRIEGENMVRNRPAEPGLSHGTDLACPLSRASLATALRYRTQAQMELRRATDLFWRHRKARLAGLLDAAEESEAAPAPEAPAPCTNEFPGEPAPRAAAGPVAAPAALCTNEFRAPVPPPPDHPASDTVTLLSTHRALKKKSATEAWAWLDELTPEDMEKISGGGQRAGLAARQRRRRRPAGRRLRAADRALRERAMR